jgi:hypothetical protein
MFLGIKSSSSSFASKTSKRSIKAKQPITSLNRIVIGNKQRCLSCKGIMQLKNGKVSLKMFDINEAYPHERDCKMKGKF